MEKNHDEYINKFIEENMKDSKEMDDKKYDFILNKILKIKPPYLITIKGFNKIIKEKYPDFNIPKRKNIHKKKNNENIDFFCLIF